MGMRAIDIAIEGLTFLVERVGTGPELPAPSSEEVAEAERLLGHALPPTYVEFMQRAGRLQLADWDLYWVGGPDLPVRNIVIANEVEHQDDESPLPAFLITFASDAETGDQLCFDTRKDSMAGVKESVDLTDVTGSGPDVPAGDEYPVVLWDRERSIEQIREGLFVVATDFADWVKLQVQDSA